MTTAVQHRRGTTAEHAAFTGLEGEVTIDTTKDTAVIHDGTLAGGYPLAKENLANVTTSGLSSIDGASTASDDKFFIFDQSATSLKTITRAELNNAIEQDALANVAITGGTINGTAIGGTTPAAGAFTTLSASGAATLSGLTASTALALDGSKNIVSVTNTGTGSNVLATSPTLVTPALGTPSALVGTNITGTATSFNINGTVGATTPASGAFTTLSASGTVTLSGGTANGVAYLNGSKVVTSGSALWFDGTNFGVGTGGNTLNHQSVVYKVGANAVYQQIANGSTGLGATNGIRVGLSSAGVGEWYSPTAAISYIDNSEAMRLTQTGLGIGTSSPTQKLDVNGGAAVTGTTELSLQRPVVPSFAGQGAPAIQWKFYSTGTTYTAGAMIQALAEAAWTSTSAPTSMRFYTVPSGSTTLQERMYLDNAGNLGLGVTPSAGGANANYRLFEIGLGGGGSLYSGGGQTLFCTNVAWSGGTANYKASSIAPLMYSQESGTHIWKIAPSGTAGNAITFTQAMTLDAGGRLLVGTTTSLSSSYAFQVGSSRSGGFYSEAAGAGDGSFVSVSNAIGYHFYAASTTQPKFYVDTTGNTYNAGNLLVGTTSSSGAKFVVDGDFSGSFGGRVNTTATTGYMQQFQTQGTERGYIYSSSSGTTYNTVSDYRLKNTIAPMTGALAKVALLKPCTYKWNVDGSDGEGFIAHELAEVVPQCVTGEKDAVDEEGNPKYQGIDTSFLVATLTAAIQELKAEFDAYKASHP